jgi:hypothetical protein
VKNNIKLYFDNINFLTEELSKSKNLNQELVKQLNHIYQSAPWKCYKVAKNFIKYPYKIFMPLLPLKYRKIIVSSLSRVIILNKVNQISHALKQEWKKSICKQPKEIKHDIFVFSLISWDFRFQRPQQLSTELSKLGHRIFYIESEFVPQKLSRNE